MTKKCCVYLLICMFFVNVAKAQTDERISVEWKDYPNIVQYQDSENEYAKGIGVIIDKYVIRTPEYNAWEKTEHKVTKNNGSAVSYNLVALNPLIIGNLLDNTKSSEYTLSTDVTSGDGWVYFFDSLRVLSDEELKKIRSKFGERFERYYKYGRDLESIIRLLEGPIDEIPSVIESTPTLKKAPCKEIKKAADGTISASCFLPGAGSGLLYQNNAPVGVVLNNKKMLVNDDVTFVSIKPAIDVLSLDSCSEENLSRIMNAKGYNIVKKVGNFYCIGNENNRMIADLCGNIKLGEVFPPHTLNLPGCKRILSVEEVNGKYKFIMEKSMALICSSNSAATAEVSDLYNEMELPDLMMLLDASGNKKYSYDGGKTFYGSGNAAFGALLTEEQIKKLSAEARKCLGL